MHEDHPVGLSVTDDLHRSRLTVFFRLILAIPHIVWLIVWSVGTFFAAIAGWVITLITGQLPGGLHRFFCAYIRYVTHVFSYLYLVTEPYPAFSGRPIDGYPVDVTLPDRQDRGRDPGDSRLGRPHGRRWLVCVLTPAERQRPLGGREYQRHGSDRGVPRVVRIPREGRDAPGPT